MYRGLENICTYNVTGEELLAQEPEFFIKSRYHPFLLLHCAEHQTCLLFVLENKTISIFWGCLLYNVFAIQYICNIYNSENCLPAHILWKLSQNVQISNLRHKLLDFKDQKKKKKILRDSKPNYKINWMHNKIQLPAVLSRTTWKGRQELNVLLCVGGLKKSHCRYS